MSRPQNRRILLIDDMPSIHEDFRKILVEKTVNGDLSNMEAALFGEVAPPPAASFELDSAYQGRDGVDKVEQSLKTDQPYAMAFVDMRMPPGWDGVETIENIWRIDGRVQVVICTAYADSTWEDVLSRLDVRDRLLILKKPFDAIEVRQLANALTAKWDAARQAALKVEGLEFAVLNRTREVSRANQLLKVEIQERKQLESQLIQSEKLASIGQLAAGIAHEINNPLCFILSNFSALETYVNNLFEMLSAYESAERGENPPGLLPALGSLRERLDLIYVKEEIPVLIKESKDGLMRVSKIVQDLRYFSHTDSVQSWEWTDIHRGIEATLGVITTEMKGRADVAREYGLIPNVQCQPSQLNQVFMSLLVNAAHATDAQRGHITIRTGTLGEEVWMEVEDKGKGISDDVLPRIFDPFFTTKPIGEGIGLGLSMSYGIVKKHNGRIDVKTEIGKGSTFRVVLPIKHVRVT